ncbi:hypothetical protein [Anaerobacterium chartisolvens]|nr:hypothetical protein [Anaerobacterium chartisolvens]
MSREQQQGLFDGSTDIRDDLVEQVEKRKPKAARRCWQLWTSVAVSLVPMVVLSGMWIVWDLGLGGWNDGSMNGTPFMSYAGPIFPLTLEKRQDLIAASRSISFDFARRSKEGLPIKEVRVQDVYVITNPTKQELAVTAVYPFTGNFRYLSNMLPKISVDQQPVQATLHAGAYSGTFEDLRPSYKRRSANLDYLKSWKGYKALLKNGAYQKQALSPHSALDQQVTVYEFSDYKEPLDGYGAATQAISFHIDPKKTTILEYGFGGFTCDENGYLHYSYFVPDDTRRYSRTKMLIVIGEDIGEYTLQRYEDSDCDAGKELEGVFASITRYGEELSNLIDRLAAVFLTENNEDSRILEYVSQEMLGGCATQLLYESQPLSPRGTSRYECGNLIELLMDVYQQDRVMYLSFPVTIPARESVTVAAGMYKEASVDYPSSGSKNVNLRGYDIVTVLGSNLRFEGQTVELLNADNTEIVRQNLGADPQNGITQVVLDTATEHYYMDIR